MPRIFQIEDDKNPKEASCTGSTGATQISGRAEFSRDGGKSWELVGHVTNLTLEWDLVEPIEVSVPVDFDGVPNGPISILGWPGPDHPGVSATGIVNHPSLCEGQSYREFLVGRKVLVEVDRKVTDQEVFDRINEQIRQLESSIERIGERIVLGGMGHRTADLLGLNTAICINALNLDAYHHLKVTGGHTGKGKKGKKRMDRKIFGGWA